MAEMERPAHALPAGGVEGPLEVRGRLRDFRAPTVAREPLRAPLGGAGIACRVPMTLPLLGVSAKATQGTRCPGTPRSLAVWDDVTSQPAEAPIPLLPEGTQAPASYVRSSSLPFMEDTMGVTLWALPILGA